MLKRTAAFRAEIGQVVGIRRSPAAFAAFNNRRVHVRRSPDTAVGAELPFMVQGSAVTAHPFAGNRRNRILLFRLSRFFF